MQKIQLVFPSGRSVWYYLTRKKIKNLNLKISYEAQIHVSAPVKTSLNFITTWLISKESWICKNLDKIAAAINFPEQACKITSNTILILGITTPLQVIPAPKVSLKVQAESVILHLPIKKHTLQTQVLNKELVKFTYQLFKKFLTELEPLLTHYQLPYPQLKIRKMSARWGSCHLFTQTITLNSCLIHAPVECVRYVLCHELAHLKHFHHQQPFYDFLTKLYPNWRQQRTILNKNYKFILQ